MFFGFGFWILPRTEPPPPPYFGKVQKKVVFLKGGAPKAVTLDHCCHFVIESGDFTREAWSMLANHLELEAKSKWTSRRQDLFTRSDAVGGGRMESTQSRLCRSSHVSQEKTFVRLRKFTGSGCFQEGFF